MSLSDLSIRNPVFAVMLSAAMVVFGYLGYRDMGISQFPEIDFPVVNVTTNWEAASPDIMESDVTDIIEDAVSSVEGIDYIQSQSLEGTSVVIVYFHLSRNIDVAMQDVQNAVSAAMSRLPADIDPPIVSKINHNRFPVMWLRVHGLRPLAEVAAFVDDKLKQHIETIPGVGGVTYGGLRPRNMRIWLDGEKLQAYQLDAVDVMQALRSEHVEKPAGYLEGPRRELGIRIMGEARTPEQFRQIPIAQRNGQIVRLGDVAVVEDGMSDKRTFSRFNGEPSVGIGVMRATGANVVALCDEVKARLPELRRMAPPGIKIDIATDYSQFIRDDIAEVNHALLLGIVLTALVTFLFLGSIGTTLNVCISIPASLIGTFMVMRWFGFTLNFMTLLALSLSVGVVVDDAILVLENIYRRREHGEERREAARRGAREITFAAVAATFSIVAIFLPVAFLRGAVGRFFFQFGISVSVAVLLSLVISLTITPMLCSLFLNVRRARRPLPGRYGGLLGPVATGAARAYWLIDRWVLELLLVRPVGWLMDQATRWYGVGLRFGLRHTWFVAPASALLAAAGLIFALGIEVPLPGWVGGGLTVRPGRDIEVTTQPALTIEPVGQELVPSEDQSRFVANIICPVGSNIEYIEAMLERCEEVLTNLVDPVTGERVIADLSASVSYRPGQLINEGVMFINLIPAERRSWTQKDVMNQVRQACSRLAGVRVVAQDLSTQGFTPTRGFPVNFAVQGPDWAAVTKLADRIRERMIDSGVVLDVNSDYRPGMPEVRVVPDKEKAAALQVPIRRIAFTLNVAFGGTRNGRFSDRDRRYDVRLRYLEGQRESPDQLDNVYVKNDRGVLVPLRDVTRRETVSTLPIINRYNHLRKVELTANTAPGVSQGEAVAYCRDLAEQIREELGLPASYRVVPLGNAQAMQQTLDSLWWCLALGFVIAYMILGVQFNSFVHPFTVLLAVPFGVTGALAILWLTGDTLNMMSMIGMVLLAGLVKKNSIILVDYTNQQRAQGLGLREAVLTACPIRLRPIVMTTFATIAAALPLALGVGPGAETRAPLARSIIGGIFLSTLVTLIIVPVFYVLFDRFGAWVRGMAERGAPAEPAERPVAVTLPAVRPSAAAVASANGVPVPHLAPVKTNGAIEETVAAKK
ncbi:MAG TPA: efflux RND transporter permease subunit [Gemmataceae bacterium]|nr:efflux RND transporter permease subunit [Gemmataceae bacterium]